LPLIEHGEAPERAVYAGGNHGRGILIAGDWKYYRYDKGRKRDRTRTFHRPLPGDTYEVGEELYNIREDPRETKNRIATRPDVAAELRRQLDDLEATMTAEREADHLQMDEQTRKQLQALGYL
jgi:hypothetical protein